jgi:DNA-binding GntR family transcriptional regulator
MGNFSLEKAEPYYEQIYQTIKRLIFEGAYKPGERIYEAKIAKEFKVSRSPVREAVRAIEKEGLLVLNEKQQLEVYKPSLEDVKEIYLCRGGLESLAVKLATERATGEELDALEAVLDQTLKAIEASSSKKEEVVICNTRFRFHFKNEREQTVTKNVE